MRSELPPIQHAVLVRASAERVYDAFTTAEGLDAWFTEGATLSSLFAHTLNRYYNLVC